MWEKLKDVMFTITHIRCWITIYPCNKEWDTLLKELSKKHTFEIEDEFIAKLGNVKVWYRNFPYASFTRFSEDAPKREKVLLKRRTIYLLMKKLINENLTDKNIFLKYKKVSPKL